MKKIFLGLGSDLGNRMQNLASAAAMINENAGVVAGRSAIYETDPWGFSGVNRFLNMVIEIESTKSPEELIIEILKIEFKMGRVRSGKLYSSRIIDIDILFYGADIISLPGLVIPHPLIGERLFVLRPLCDLAPLFVHPENGRTIKELLSICNDKGIVKLYDREIL